MIFRELIRDLSYSSAFGTFDIDVNSITAKSAVVTKGSVYVAIVGSTQDGHQYIESAISKGASVLVVTEASRIPKSFEGTYIIASDTRQLLDQMCCRFYRQPSEELYCVGVTGTNGKTTTTYIIEKVFSDQSVPTAVMGTVDHHFKNTIYPSQLTTPGPELLHARLREFVDAGAKAVALEVSSHALDQKRVYSMHFDAAVFTNLTRDHLDYHATMDSYFQAKELLFYDQLWRTNKARPIAVINGDDWYGRKIKVPRRARKVYFGSGELGSCDYKFSIKKIGFAGMTIAIHSNKMHLLDTTLIGKHNAYNLTSVFALACEMGLSAEMTKRSLAEFSGVPGRLERVKNTRGLNIFVDYAHTDDALKNVLSSLKSIKEHEKSTSQIITVFGCGGDRDKGKRPLMAAVAEQYSDSVVLTSDNPRTESPHQIISDIESGFSKNYLQSSVSVEVDRKSAIKLAFQKAQKDDVILIAGKGHENYQIIGTETRDFSDVQVAQEILNETQ